MTGLDLIELDESKAYMLPYAPAIKVPPGSEYFFLSGVTEAQGTSDDYPDDIRAQVHRVLGRHTEVLAANGLTWDHVLHVYEFLTDMREADAVHAAMGEFYRATAPSAWKPADTLIGVNALRVPGARFELDLIAARGAEGQK